MNVLLLTKAGQALCGLPAYLESATSSLTLSDHNEELTLNVSTDPLVGFVQ